MPEKVSRLVEELATTDALVAMLVKKLSNDEITILRKVIRVEYLWILEEEKARRA